ncbi:MAG: hypothetical protein QXR76_03340 [Candidatus Bathyarchaeia archaeon]
MSDLKVRIRKVCALHGKAEEQAKKQGLNPNDLVIVETIFVKGSPPQYHIKKIVGDPISLTSLNSNFYCCVMRENYLSKLQ